MNTKIQFTNNDVTYHTTLDEVLAKIHSQEVIDFINEGLDMDSGDQWGSSCVIVWSGKSLKWYTASGQILHPIQDENILLVITYRLYRDGRGFPIYALNGAVLDAVEDELAPSYSAVMKRENDVTYAGHDCEVDA